MGYLGRNFLGTKFPGTKFPGDEISVYRLGESTQSKHIRLKSLITSDANPIHSTIEHLTIEKLNDCFLIILDCFILEHFHFPREFRYNCDLNLISNINMWFCKRTKVLSTFNFLFHNRLLCIDGKIEYIL